MSWIFTLFCVLLVCLPQALWSAKKVRIRGVKWWSLARAGGIFNNVLTPTTPVYINPNSQPLTRKQRRLVNKNPGTLTAIAKGARFAIDECQFQFRTRRWNCPTNDDSHGGSIFGKILKKGCRETAFIYALMSASVTHSVARACSEGSVYTCSCGQKLPRRRHSRGWQWGGCSDNAEFGHKFSRDFVDTVERGRDLRYMMNLHNNEAGRRSVSTEMRQNCKCHGTSGSCTIKTCWMSLPNFRQLGDMLKDRFDGASRVFQSNSGNGRERNKFKKFNLLPVNPNHKPPTNKDLVYYENSPSFCDANSVIGFKGTKGRQCNDTSIGLDGCDLMCCGRGFKTESYMARERCNCTFQWCCKVNCHICTRKKMRHTCL